MNKLFFNTFLIKNGCGKKLMGSTLCVQKNSLPNAAHKMSALNIFDTKTVERNEQLA